MSRKMRTRWHVALAVSFGIATLVAQAAASTPDEATLRSLGERLAGVRAVRVRISSGVNDVQLINVHEQGLKVYRDDSAYRDLTRTIPWAEIQAIEVRTKDRAGSALRRASLGLFLGIPLGYAIGYGVVRGDLSDMNALAPPLFGVLGGATGLVGGAISGVAWPAQSRHWKRVWQSDTAGEAAVRDSAAADSLSR